MSSVHRINTEQLRRTKFGQRAKEEEIHICKHTDSSSSPNTTSGPQLYCPARDEEVLQLLEDSVLKHWVNNQNQRRSNSTPEGTDSVICQDTLNRLEDTELLSLDRLGRRRGFFTMFHRFDCLGGLHYPNWVTDQGGSRS